MPKINKERPLPRAFLSGMTRGQEQGETGRALSSPKGPAEGKGAHPQGQHSLFCYEPGVFKWGPWAHPKALQKGREPTPKASTLVSAMNWGSLNWSPKAGWWSLQMSIYKICDCIYKICDHLYKWVCDLRKMSYATEVEVVMLENVNFSTH